MRRVWIFRDAPSEGEHQHLHARQAEARHQLAHVVRDDAEVLSDERQLTAAALLAAEGFEHLSAERRPPAPVLRRLALRGNLPERREAAEMVYPRDGAVFQNMAQPRAPPGEAVAAHLLPSVERIAPALPRLAEIVRRHARDAARPAVRLEVEKFARGPYVRAVPRDVDRRVAHQLDAELRAVGGKRAELAEEYELRKFYKRELLRALSLEARKRRPVAVRELRGPVRPAAFAVLLFQQGIERVVAKPVIFFRAEFFKFIGHLTIPAAFEAREGERTEPRAYLRRGGEVCGAPGRNGAAVKLRLRR